MNRSKFLPVKFIAVLLSVVALPALAADSYADDRAKIENLQARYMFAMDFRDADAYASCFAEDGELDYAGGVEKGRKAIREMIVKMREREVERNTQAAKEKPGSRPPRMRHNITNIVLKIEGNKATGRAYWVEFENRKDVSKAEVGAYGHYEDELRKVNGEWLFTKRKIYNEQVDRRVASDKSPAW